MTLDRERLARLLGMMGSAHDGEVVNAARQAEKLRRQAGLTWPEILTPPSAPQPQPMLATRRSTSIDERIELCVDFQYLLDDWGRGFVASIARRPGYSLSQKQRKVLDRLARSIAAQLGA